VFGGDPEEGIQIMQKALAAGTAERDDLFNIYLGLGLAYGKLKKHQAEQEWLLQALQLYSRNIFAQREYERACR